jgi:chloride channel protein, CIC family
MTPTRYISANEIGHLCIYLTRKDRMPAKGRLNFLPRRPLAQHIIDLAKRDGILNATSHSTHYGFTGRGDIETIQPDHGNDRLATFVELVAEREQLEKFVCTHEALLKDKVVVYKHLEQWTVKNHATEARDLG